MKIKEKNQSSQSKQAIFEEMSFKLSNKLNRSCAVTMDIWCHIFTTKPEITFQICLVPGLGNEKCTIYKYKTWRNFINQYHNLLQTKRETF